jgi:AcrR family transcriptional regulator
MSAHGQRATPMPPAQRREALIEATLPLLRSKGADVTTKQIAEACGVAEGTLFRVFPDKESLINAAFARAVEPDAALAKLRSIEPGLPLEQRLIAVVDILRARLEEVFTLLHALRWPRPPAHHRGEQDRPDQLMIEAIVDVVGADSEQFRYSATEAISLLRLLVFAGTHPFINPGNPLTSERIVAYLMDGVRQHQAQPNGTKPNGTKPSRTKRKP